MIAFLIGAMVYASIFAFVIGYHVSVSGSADQPDNVELGSRARDALSLMLADAGVTSSGSTEWYDDADNIVRFGLSEPGSPNLVNYSKVDALRHGLTASTANGYADYDDVKAALGLDGYDFHIRTYPVFISEDDASWAPYRGIRAAYLAHYGSPTAPATATLTSANAAGYQEISASITNNAAESIIYRVSFILTNSADGATIAVDDQFTNLLAPAGVGSATMRYYDAAWAESAYDIIVRVWDPWGTNVAEVTVASVDLDDAVSPDTNLIVDAGVTHYVTGTDIDLHLDHYKGDGKRKSSGYSAKLAIVSPSSVELVNTTVSLPKDKALTYTCAAATCSAPGTYTVKLMTTSDTRVVTDKIHVTTSAMFTSSSSPSADATTEVDFMNTLFGDFDETLYDESTNPDGDVFKDTDHGAQDMAGMLSRYDLVMIGSGVKQSSLTAASVKYAIADWVEAGGTLVVLGSGNQNYQWLQPLHGSGIHTASGGVSAPDPTHPTLHVPETLSWQRYEDNDNAWRVKNNEYYSHVLSKPDAANGQSQSTLSVSDPGSFGNGSVVLTSYMPAQLTSPQDDSEAKKFMHNLITQSYNMLFLDYGPPIPRDAAVGSSTRLAMIQHPSVSGALVEVQIVLYVFR